jgi:hypothetical protein
LAIASIEPVFLKVDRLVQTQVLGPLDIPVNPLFSKRFSTPSNCLHATVDKNVAARTSEIQQ